MGERTYTRDRSKSITSIRFGVIVLRFSKIKDNDVANGIGINMSLWTQGCPHHCKGCFNLETWDFNGGKEFTIKVTDNMINDCFCKYSGGPSIFKNRKNSESIVNSNGINYHNIKHHFHLFCLITIHIIIIHFK